MAAVAAGTIYLSKTASSQPRRPLTLGDANANIGFGVTNALNEANRKVHSALELTQEQKNQMLMDSYGERSSLEDMERAIAGMEAKMTAKKDRRRILEEAYGDKASLEDLQLRALERMQIEKKRRNIPHAERCGVAPSGHEQTQTPTQSVTATCISRSDIEETCFAFSVSSI